MCVAGRAEPGILQRAWHSLNASAFATTATPQANPLHQWQ